MGRPDPFIVYVQYQCALSCTESEAGKFSKYFVLALTQIRVVICITDFSDILLNTIL